MNITVIKKDDIFLGKINIGDMPPTRAKLYLEEVKENFKKYFQNEVILVGTADTKDNAVFEILRKE